MNPYAPSTAKPKTKHEALFAAEVYLDESPAKAEVDEGIGAELAQLRSELRGEARALRSAIARPRVPAELLAETATLRAAVDELLATPKRGDLLASTIRTRGIEGPAAAAIARSAKSIKDRGAKPVERLRAAAATFVTATPWPLALAAKGKILIGLVGPAGVGKTTTAAKLGAHARMAGKSVALISCDSFRVGAIDQLGKYAELMDARFYSAGTQQELLEVLAEEDADVIIIDTSGRAIDIDATEALLGAPELRGVTDRRAEVLLCLPATIRAEGATRAHRDFAIAKPTALAITKIDETDAPAGIAHAAFSTRLSVSTLCAGQCVPEDIAPATGEALGALLFPLPATTKGRADR